MYGSLVKYEVPKFDGKTNFSLWKYLVLQGLWKTVEEKVSESSDGSMVESKEKGMSYIFSVQWITCYTKLRL